MLIGRATSICAQSENSFPDAVKPTNKTKKARQMPEWSGVVLVTLYFGYRGIFVIWYHIQGYYQSKQPLRAINQIFQSKQPLRVTKPVFSTQTTPKEL